MPVPSVFDFDLIVTGSGPSASTVAKKSIAAGKRVAVIEAREFGFCNHQRQRDHGQDNTTGSPRPSSTA